MTVQVGKLQQDSELPKLNGIQFDGNSQLVNLFRGSVSFPVQLLELPGRNGLSFNTSIFYQSDIAAERVTKWSLDKPSGVVGVGWDMPYERIVVEMNANGTLDDNKYFWIMAGQPTQLLPMQFGWSCGVLDYAFQGNLEEGTISSSLKEGLKDQQIAVADTATLIDMGGGVWELNDPVYERIYNLKIQEDGNVYIETGGISFELYNYQYWRISYYSSYERWEIIKNDGGIYSFGGDGVSIGGSAPNTKQYGVKWGNWIGPSIEVTGQEQYVKAWNLAKVENTLGNYYIINYDTQTQPVGEGGVTYTKSCLVSKVKNDLGWYVTYDYKDKIYDDADLKAPKEYLDPHKDPSVVPGITPDAYQSSYLTKYLTQLNVYNDSDELQTYIRLNYHKFETAEGPIEVWNPNPAPTAGASNEEQLAYGATFDRYLKSITQYVGESAGLPEQVLDRYSMPGLLLNYNFTTDVSTPRGLLREIVNATGGKTEFTYKSISAGDGFGLPGSRDLEVKNPFSINSPGTVRTWYGQDYVVCCWYNEISSTIKLNVFTWVGRWEPGFPEWVVITIPIDLDHLQVSTSQNTFLLTLPPSAAYLGTPVYFFNRDKLQNATWKMNTGTSPVQYLGNQLKVYSGDDFFLVQNDNGQVIDRYTWDYLNQIWRKYSHQIPNDQTYYATVSANYYVIFAYNPLQESGVFTYYGRDIQLNWSIQTSYSINTISIPYFNGFSYFQMSPSQSFVAISMVTGYVSDGGGFSKFDYEIKILRWSTDYTLSMATIENLENGRFNNIPASLLYGSPGIGPVPIDNAAIGTGPNYIRFDGLHWKCEGLGIDYEGFEDLAHQYYWYAYDEQGVIKTENTDSGIFSMVGSTDPSNAVYNWTSETLLDLPEHIVDRYIRAYPTNAGQYLTIGEKVYCKSLSSNWGTLSGRLMLTIGDHLNLGETVDTTTLINSGEYMVFLILDQYQNPKDTGIIYFKNGTFVKNSEGVLDIDRFEGQKVFQFFASDHRYKSNVNGKLSPIISGVIAYPVSAASLDATPSITLNRYSAEDFKGEISEFVVSSITQDSGYDTMAKCYQYDSPQAAADGFSGSILKFYKVTEYEGCADPSNQQNGFTISYFYNGLPVTPGTQTIEPAYTMLDGQLQKKEIYNSSKVLKSSLETMWQIQQKIAVDPEELDIRPIYGAIPQVIKVKSMQEDIWRESTSSYSLASGNSTQANSDYYDSQGRKILNQTQTAYAYQYYEGIWNQNILALPAQTTTYVKEDNSGQSWAIVSSQVQTYKLWELDPEEITQWGTLSSFAATKPTSTFTWWTSGAPTSDDGWICTNTVLSRGPQGNVISSQDVEGIKTTSIYDNSNNFVLATFNNASFADGVCYTSFEDYQTDSWTLTGTGNITPDDAFTGNKCCQLTSTASSTSSISKTVNIANLNQFYCFNLWVKTPLVVNTGDVIALVISASGGTPLTTTVPLTPTQGVWYPVQWVSNLSSLGVTGPVDVTLTISFTSPSTSSPEDYLRIDDVIFAPVLSPFSAAAYDMPKLRPMGGVSANCVSRKVLYDMWGQYCEVGTYDQTTSLGASYSVRQNPSYNPDSFPQYNPNSAIALGGRGKGFYDLFKSNESLNNYTAVDGSVANWSVVDKTLKISTGAGFQVLQVGGSYSQQDLAAYVNVVPRIIEGETNPAQIFYLGIMEPGSSPTQRFLVQWNGIGVQEWQILKWNSASYAYNPVVTNTDVSWQPNWLLTIFEDRLFFTANGILIFDYQDPDIAATLHTVQLGTYYDDPVAQGEVGFKNLTIVDDIQFGMVYSDGLGRSLQTIAAESSTSVIMTPSVYDTLGRPAISVLPSRIVQGERSVTNAFAYDTFFITNGSNQGSLWSGNPVEGNITFYHADAEGYPFSRAIYEPSPGGRPLYQGGPGVKFAILPNNTNKHIVRYTYGTNTGIMETFKFLYPLPQGQYHVANIIDADGNRSVTYATTAKQVIATINLRPVYTPGDPVIKASQVYDMKGQLIASIPPQYYQDNPNPETKTIPASASTFQYNFLGRKVSETYPDSGASRVIYDVVGRPRFMQDHRGEMEDYYSYMKYDILGRSIETGILRDTWDQSSLENKAKTEPDWPISTTIGIEPHSNTTYDGDSTTEFMVGRPLQSQAYNGDVSDNAVITNLYTYRPTGETITETQETMYNGLPGLNAYMTYMYDINGRLFSAKDSITNVESQYNINKLGQLIETRVTTGSKIVKATYTYDQQGSIEDTILYKPDGSPLTTRAFTYLSNGWLDTASDDFVVQDLKYIEGACDDPTKGYYNGDIAHNTVTYNVTTPTPQPSDYCYKMDYLNRVVGANNTGGIDYAWEFDDNSNFKTYTLDSEIRNYITTVDKNQLTQITSTAPDFVRNFSYDENGNTHTITNASSSLLNIAYNTWNAKARSIERPQDLIESVFDYGPSNQRVRKRVYNNGTLTNTIYNTGDLEIENKGTTVQTKKFVDIIGSQLVYYMEGNKFYWVMPDHLGSTRMIIDEEGNIQYLYNYDVYGVPTIVPIASPVLIYYYLFTGQYYDAELQIYDYNARFYDPATARFLQVDPAYQFYNPYSYAGGMPNMATDPSGEDFGISALILGIVMSAAIGAAAGAGVSAAIASVEGKSRDDIRKAAGEGAIVGALAGMFTFGIGTGLTASFAALSVRAGSTLLSNIGRGAFTGLVSEGVGGYLGSRAAIAAQGQRPDWTPNIGDGINAIAGAVTGGINGYRGFAQNQDIANIGNLREGGNHEAYPVSIALDALDAGESLSSIKLTLRTRHAVVDGFEHNGNVRLRLNNNNGPGGNHMNYTANIASSLDNPLMSRLKILWYNRTNWTDSSGNPISWEVLDAWGDAFAFRAKVLLNTPGALIRHPFNVAYGVSGRFKPGMGWGRRRYHSLPQVDSPSPADVHLAHILDEREVEMVGTHGLRRRRRAGN